MDGPNYHGPRFNGVPLRETYVRLVSRGGKSRATPNQIARAVFAGSREPERAAYWWPRPISSDQREATKEKERQSSGYIAFPGCPQLATSSSLRIPSRRAAACVRLGGLLSRFFPNCVRVVGFYRTSSRTIVFVRFS